MNAFRKGSLDGPLVSDRPQARRAIESRMNCNHIYLQLIEDGDQHTVTRPDTIRPCTVTEMLERILGRDDTPRSASTMLQEQQDPAVRLGDSIERYIDALHMAAEDVYHTISGDPCRPRHRLPR
jgi:hypothetical protein